MWKFQHFLFTVITVLEKALAVINPSKKRNFQLVNWDCFRKESNRHLIVGESWQMADDVNVAYNFFCETLRAARKLIPRAFCRASISCQLDVCDNLYEKKRQCA